ncbi:MAG: hypothetical protein C0592_08690 [Marinilabiliales bacterium]|nr:MAG: hypothetical protein C0592_08690 [Marinilabiliales bacterium]
MRTALLLVFLAFTSLGIAQNDDYLDYTWEGDSCNFAITDSLNDDYSAIILKDCYIQNQYYDENDDLKEIVVIHKAYRVCKEKAIEDYNTLNIYLNRIDTLLKVDARVFTPDGNVFYLDQKDIKTVENEAGEGDYKAIALPGVEKNAVIEYYWVAKRDPILINNMNFQYSIPCYDVDYVLEVPDFLGYVSKSYNGLPDLDEEVDEDEETRKYFFHSDYLPALPSQPWAETDPYAMRMSISVGYNYNRNAARILTHAEFASNLYAKLFELEKKETKVLKKIVKASKSKSEDRLIAAREIENYLKEEYTHISLDIPAFRNLVTISEFQLASETGIVKLYMNVFKNLDYEVQLLYTCSRDEMPFDKDFDAYTHIDEPILYFPEFDMYTSPTITTSRIGFPNAYLMGQQALYLKEVEVVGEGIFLPKYAEIGVTDWKLSGDSIYQNVTIDPEELTAHVNTYRSQIGYKAMPVQAFYDVISDEDEFKYEDMVDYLMAFYEIEPLPFVMDSVEFENGEPEDILIKPFIMKGNFSGDELLEESAGHILVDVGLLIGPQAELYDSIPRTLPVDHGYTNHYYREIRVQIPDGYKVDNPEAFTMDVRLGEGASSTAWFTSEYKTEGNEFVIISEEAYTEIHYSLEDYEAFRDVVNAAANFNKLRLVLVKE